MLERTLSLGCCNCSILLSLPETRCSNNATQISPLFRSRSSLAYRPVQSENLLYTHMWLDKNIQTGSQFPNRHYTGAILFRHWQNQQEAKNGDKSPIESQECVYLVVIFKLIESQYFEEIPTQMKNVANKGGT